MALDEIDVVSAGTLVTPVPETDGQSEMDPAYRETGLYDDPVKSDRSHVVL